MMETYKNSASWRKIWPVILVLAVLSTLFLWGWSSRRGNEKKVNALAAEDPPLRVSTLSLKPNTALQELVLPSSAQAWHFTPIWARVNGYLLRYLVDIGDVVKQGELLAELDTPETDAELEQAQADLLNAIELQQIAKITSDRWQRLWEKNKEAVSKQEVDQYSANLKASDAVVAANEQNVSKIATQQQFKFVYAPFDGIITQRSVDIGTLVYGSVNGIPQELFQMVKTDTIRFFVQVPQTYFRHIKEGLEVEVTVQEYPGKTFKGSVTRFAKALDPTARTLLTQVDVPNPDGLLYAGLYATVKFLLPPDTPTFSIPTSALIIRDSLPQVAIVGKDNRVRLQNVEIRRDFGNQMEIAYGLKEHEQIIVLPNDSIRDGIQVEVRQ